MAEIKTEQELINDNNAKVKGVTQDDGVTPTSLGEHLENIIYNYTSGAAASRSVNMTGNLTYNPKLHRGAKIIAKALPSSVTFTIPSGMTDFDWCLLLNEGGYDINISYNLGQVKNIVDKQRVTIIQSGGYGLIFKDKEPGGPTFNMWIAGNKLSQALTFAAASGYPNATNMTTTGGQFNGNYNKNYQYWAQIVADGSPPPSVSTIKSQTGGLGNFSNTGNANAVKATTFLISGASPATNYDIYWVAEPTDGSLAQLAGKVDIQTAAAPAVGDVTLRNSQFFKQGDGKLTNWGFTCNVDASASSIMLVEICFRGPTDFSVNNLVIGGRTFTKIAQAITVGTSTPNYDYLYMLTKANMPANGAGVVGTITPSNASLTGPKDSLSVNVIVLEGAEQLVIPSSRIKTFAGTGVASHAHNFTGLPSKYMLLSFGSTLDPNDNVNLGYPVSQTGITGGALGAVDTEKVSKAVSYKLGTAPSNSVEVENGNTGKLNHIAVQVNPA